VSVLDWRPAQGGDRALLQAFTCTEPAHYDRQRRRRLHPRPWELVVQRGIHSVNPATEGQSLYLGLDDEGIGAACLFAALAPGEVRLMAVAVALRYRRQGGAVADEAITETLRAAASQPAHDGQSHVYMAGSIHDQNIPSQRMCQRRGFTYEGAEPALADHQRWSVLVSLDPRSGAR
jgi:hypothetical protein